MARDNVDKNGSFRNIRRANARLPGDAKSRGEIQAVPISTRAKLYALQRAVIGDVKIRLKYRRNSVIHYNVINAINYKGQEHTWQLSRANCASRGISARKYGVRYARYFNRLRAR